MDPKRAGEKEDWTGPHTPEEVVEVVTAYAVSPSGPDEIGLVAAEWRRPAFQCVAASILEDQLWPILEMAQATGSPIEERLLYALIRRALTFGLGVRWPDETVVVHQPRTTHGWMTLEPQGVVTASDREWHPDFRVWLEWDGDGKTKSIAHVLVECDGHDFHERTKEQAARDKSRDRAFIKAGHTVIRFAGSEIHRDANHCAYEVFEVLWRALRSKAS